MEKKRVTLRLLEDVVLSLKKRALEAGLSMSDYVAKVVDEKEKKQKQLARRRNKNGGNKFSI
jgi:predicted DNA binding CopG/RHH family protein